MEKEILEELKDQLKKLDGESEGYLRDQFYNLTTTNPNFWSIERRKVIIRDLIKEKSK